MIAAACGTGSSSAIRATVLTGPVKARVDYFVFEVLSVHPEFRLGLKDVEGMLAERLDLERRDSTLVRFEADMRWSWSARTSCRSEYSVPKCGART